MRMSMCFEYTAYRMEGRIVLPQVKDLNDQHISVGDLVLRAANSGYGRSPHLVKAVVRGFTQKSVLLTELEVGRDGSRTKNNVSIANAHRQLMILDHNYALPPLRCDWCDSNDHNETNWCHSEYHIKYAATGANRRGPY